MKVEKYYCDVCGKEINNERGKVVFLGELFPYSSDDYYDKYHLCEKCGCEVIKTLTEMLDK